MKKGIDVSEHNGVIDWEKVKSQIDFAILRLGWIGNKKNHTLDQQFERNYNECKRLGIPIGLYVFNYCNSEEASLNGALWTILQLKGKTIDLPIYIDMEDDEKQKVKLSETPKEILTKVVEKFNTILEANGFWAGVYSNQDWFKNHIDGQKLKERFSYWIANPENVDNLEKFKDKFDLFQYSWKGNIDGINSEVDMNVLYRDTLQEEILNSKIDSLPNNNETSNISQNGVTFVQARKSDEVIVDEVINGLWGNGEERKNKLQEAGYDYNTIQSKVNEWYEAQKPQEIYYTVVKGDNLSKIAQRFGVKWTDIYNINKSKIGNNPNLIKPRSKIKNKIIDKIIQIL